MRPDVEEFFCGISFDAYHLLGSHPAGPGRGWLFTLWAPHARRVQLLGDWNGWDLYSAAELTFCEDGLWRGRVPQAQLGQLYKYNIQGPDGSWQLRADPFAFAFEALPGTASRLAEPKCPPGCSRSDLRTARRQLAPPLGRPLLYRAGAGKKSGALSCGAPLHPCGVFAAGRIPV